VHSGRPEIFRAIDQSREGHRRRRIDPPKIFRRCLSTSRSARIQHATEQSTAGGARFTTTERAGWAWRGSARLRGGSSRPATARRPRPNRESGRPAPGLRKREKTTARTERGDGAPSTSAPHARAARPPSGAREPRGQARAATRRTSFFLFPAAATERWGRGQESPAGWRSRRTRPSHPRARPRGRRVWHVCCRLPATSAAVDADPGLARTPHGLRPPPARPVACAALRPRVRSEDVRFPPPRGCGTCGLVQPGPRVQLSSEILFLVVATYRLNQVRLGLWHRT